MKRYLIVFITALTILTPHQGETFTFGGGKKNVILIIPDGCSAALWAVIRTVAVGTDSLLNFDSLSVQGRCSTYASNSMITDSAASATAYATGSKTKNGVLSMNALTVRGDSLSGKSLETIAEMAMKKGYSTGIISTSTIVDATPAAFYAHRAERGWGALIAGDLAKSGFNVIMGGGRSYMIPKGTVDEEQGKSSRSDNRSIIDEMRAAGYVYAGDKSSFDSINPAETDKVFAIFNSSAMQYEFDRLKDKLGEPSLAEMTSKALKILSKNKKGFFLMVEAGKIDHAAHGNDAERTIWDGIACDKAIGVAKAFAKENRNTLVIVVPDHGTGGPNGIGISVKDKEAVVSPEEVGGFLEIRRDQNGYPTPDNDKTVAVGWSSSPPFLKTGGKGGSHTTEDVLVGAMGPGSQKLDGFFTNTYVFRVMAEHLGLLKANKKQRDLGEIVDP